jgi:hypothetical protein
MKYIGDVLNKSLPLANPEVRPCFVHSYARHVFHEDPLCSNRIVWLRAIGIHFGHSN